jgi:hypothetical protein
VIQFFETPQSARCPRAKKADAESVRQIVTRTSGQESRIVDSTGEVTNFKTDGTITHFNQFEFSSESSFSLIDQGFLVCDPTNYKLTVFWQFGRFDSTDIEIGLEIGHVVSSGTNFCVIVNRSVIELYDIQEFPNASAVLAVTEDVIQSAVMSSTFHLLCAVTRDNVLHFHSLKKLKQTAAARIELSSVKRLLIIPTWVFVVDFGSELTVFTVTGKLVGNCKHDRDFLHSGVFASADDFDCIVAADIKGKPIMIDPYRRTPIEIIKQLVWQIFFADYIRDDHCPVVASSTGKALMIGQPFAKL